MLLDQHNELRQELLNNMEAKHTAAKTRIDSFYRAETGKINKVTFSHMKPNKKHKTIDQIQTENMTSPTKIHEEIAQHMSEWYEETATSPFTQTQTVSEFLSKRQVNLPRIPRSQADTIDTEFTQDEIKSAIQAADPCTAPGPSGQTITDRKSVV